MDHTNENTGKESPETGSEYVLPHTYELKHPIQLSEKKTVTQITFRNPLDGKAMESLPAGGQAYLKMGHFYPIICHMTGEFRMVVDRMNFEDIQYCIGVISSFLGDGQGTGDNDM